MDEAILGTKIVPQLITRSLQAYLCFWCQKLSLYSIGGGTNWVNLGYPDFYASYDLGAIIAEEGTVTREKYSEAKSQGQFFKVALATTLHGLSNQIQPRCYHPAYEYVHSPYTSAKHPMELKQAPTKVTFQALFHDIHVYR